MKYLFLLIISFFTLQTFVLAQPILFQNEAVDTIVIEGAEHHYAYGAAQTNKKDKLIIAYSKRTKTYKILNYEREIAKYPANHGYPKITKKSKPTFISKRKLQSNLNLLIENIDTSIFPVKITDYYKKRKIQRKISFWKVLKAYKDKYDIEDFMDIEISHHKYKKCKSLIEIDSILNFRFSNPITMSHANSMTIKIITIKSTYLYETSELNILLQPLYKRDIKQSITNINVSITLAGILPKKFIERENLLLDNLIDNYIRWVI